MEILSQEKKFSTETLPGITHTRKEPQPLIIVYDLAWTRTSPQNPECTFLYTTINGRGAPSS